MGLVKSRAATLMGGVALAIVAAQGAAAQNVNTTNVTLLERLVIGAGAPKVAIDTPQAVTVIDQEDLDKTQATTVGDIFESVPGVTMLGSDNVLGQAFNIRGIGVTENTADAARIIINVDGVPKFNEQYRMGSFFSEPELYKQVEVLRGPASSTLYGAGALGGVINFTTKDASDFIADGKTGAIRAKASYDSNGDGTLLSGIWAHQLNETFDILAAGNWRRAEDFTFADGTIGQGTDFSTLSGLIKGTAQFGENDEQVLRLSYQRWNSDDPDQPYVQTQIDPAFNTAFGFTDRTVTDDTVVLSYENPASDNPWLDTNIQLSYSNTQNSQSDGTSSAIPGVPSTAILDDTTYVYRNYQLKADNTVEWIGDNFENYFTFGFQASHQDRLAERPNPSSAQRLLQHPEGTEDKLGLFVQNEFVYDERLTLIAGMRGDFSAISPSAEITGARDISNEAFSPKIAALYDINDNIGVFGSVAYTERLPTIDELYTVQNSGAGMNMDLLKERAVNYELGGTLSGFDLIQSGDQASLKLTGFYNDLHDLIATSGSRSSATFPAVVYYANVDRARIYGIEAEAAYNSDLFFANLAYTATWGYDNSNDRPLRAIPAHRVVLSAGARVPEFNLEVGARAKLVSDSENSVAATTTSPVVPRDGYQSYDLFASWKPDTGVFAGTTLQASIENIFNADYRDNLSQTDSKGRTFKLTLSKQFDY
ncbi:MAG: TonB-dependent receptor [Candidatus Devosia phytovorans]|uniref:TonB-dependent receptor n=1 Tax=Candidatus Devosia phytovorans TaxID=3121372 RepID=A0AAJ6B175_9HYPH|nr:TonB-dependent receptor [Devosia sp.]WEK06470.1 MAG: TonB-dependent receptor [Devosia sp.]